MSMSRTSLPHRDFSLRGLAGECRVAERGGGIAGLFAVLRWAMVMIFASFGIQKFTAHAAEGIHVYIANSPFVSFLTAFGVRGEADLLGCIELLTMAMLIAGAFVPVLSVLGAAMGTGTFLITWSFFFTTPGVVRWSFSSDPIAWNLAGEFLWKDLVLLGVCAVLLVASLPPRVLPRSLR